MAELLMEYSSKLNDNELSMVIDYVKSIINNRDKNIINEDYQNFLDIREETKKNGTGDMSLEEINAIIKKTRAERKQRVIA